MTIATCSTCGKELPAGSPDRCVRCRYGPRRDLGPGGLDTQGRSMKERLEAEQDEEEPR